MLLSKKMNSSSSGFCHEIGTSLVECAEQHRSSNVTRHEGSHPILLGDARPSGIATSYMLFGKSHAAGDLAQVQNFVHLLVFDPLASRFLH